MSDEPLLPFKQKIFLLQEVLKGTNFSKTELDDQFTEEEAEWYFWKKCQSQEAPQQQQQSQKQQSNKKRHSTGGSVGKMYIYMKLYIYILLLDINT